MSRSRIIFAARTMLFGFLLLACTGPCAQESGTPESAPPAATAAAELAAPPGNPISLWGRPLLTLRAPIGKMAAADRAHGAQDRLDDALAHLDPASLHATWIESDESRGVLIGGNTGILFGIVVGDVEGGRAEVEREGQDVIAKMRAILAERAEAERPQAILRGLAYSLLGTLVTILAGWGLVLGMRRIDRRLGTIIDALPISTKLHTIEMRPLLWNGLRRLLALLRFVVLLGLGYVWLGFVLRRFAYTRPWGDALAGYLVSAAGHIGRGFVESIPSLITLLLIALVTRATARVAGAWFHRVESGRIEVDWLDPAAAGATRRMISIGIWLFALTVAYPYIPGSGSEAFKGISVFVGLMLSLGSAGIVNQVVSGFVVLYSRAIRVGDVVKVGEHLGTVRELGSLSLRLVTRKHEEIIVPNSVLAGTAVENYTRQLREHGALIVATPVTIDYGVPWRQVHALLELAAVRTAGVAAEPKPFVLQTAPGHVWGRVPAPRRRRQPVAATVRPVRAAQERPGPVQRVRRADHGAVVRGPAGGQDRRAARAVARGAGRGGEVKAQRVARCGRQRRRRRAVAVHRRPRCILATRDSRPGTLLGITPVARRA